MPTWTTSQTGVGLRVRVRKGLKGVGGSGVCSTGLFPVCSWDQRKMYTRGNVVDDTVFFYL